MCDYTVTKQVRISNPQGLHARPAYLFAAMAGRFKASVEVVKDGERVDGKSILSLLTLGAAKDTQLSLVARGHDAAQAIDALVELVEQGFGRLEEKSGVALKPPGDGYAVDD